MKLKVIGSSSEGNCYLLESDTGILILDAGVPFKNIQKALNFDFSRVIGCLVTHEHNDHSKAVRELMMAGINVYMSKGTAQALNLSGHRLKIIERYQNVIKGFLVIPFDTEHDAAEPYAYIVEDILTREKLLFATDTFYIRYCFPGYRLNYIMIECNYCKDILDANIEAGRIPEALKNRILQSHMSLDTCKKFLMANKCSELRKVILIHLSEGNSDSARMQSEIHDLVKVETVVADSGMEIDLDLYPY